MASEKREDMTATVEAQVRRIAELEAEPKWRCFNCGFETSDESLALARLKAKASTLSDEVGRLKAKLAWRSVTDAKPAAMEMTLACLSSGVLVVAWLRRPTDDWWECREGVLRRTVVTHWMPLPPHPDAAMQPAEQAKEQG